MEVGVGELVEELDGLATGGETELNGTVTGVAGGSTLGSLEGPEGERDEPEGEGDEPEGEGDGPEGEGEGSEGEGEESEGLEGPEDGVGVGSTVELTGRLVEPSFSSSSSSSQSSSSSSSSSWE